MDGMRFRSLCANVDRLSLGQVRELRRKLRALDARREVLARIDARGQALECCIHCGASALVRWGSTRTGLQRLRCKACGRTFSAASGTVVARVRLPEKLQQVVADMFAPVPSSCRGLAARLGVDKMTVWRWRAGILKALDGIGAQRLGGIVEADETYMRESRKGSREWVDHARDPLRFPAPPRPRWRDFMSAKLAIPDNMTLLPLPPRSPELNPAENIWQFMRDNWLSNRVFLTYDDNAPAGEEHSVDCEGAVDQPVDSAQVSAFTGVGALLRPEGAASVEARSVQGIHPAKAPRCCPTAAASDGAVARDQGARL